MGYDLWRERERERDIYILDAIVIQVHTMMDGICCSWICVPICGNYGCDDDDDDDDDDDHYDDGDGDGDDGDDDDDDDDESLDL